MEKIAMVGRLLSENKGIDAIIKYSARNHYLKHIVVCGVDTRGHLAGHALLSLYRNGIGLARQNSEFKESKTRDHNFHAQMVENFRKRVRIYDLFGVTDLDTIKEHVDKIQ